MEDYHGINSLLAALAAPFTFILGLVGWHYRSIVKDVKDLSTEQGQLKILVHQHSVHVENLHDCIHKLDKKIDQLIEKF